MCGPLRSGVASGVGYGAIGGATSALIAPYLVEQAGGAANLTDGQRAAIVGMSTLLGGVAAGLAGQNAQAGANAAENEALNNGTQDHGVPKDPMRGALDVACASGTQACDTKLLQTMVQAQGANAD